ncbi:MAG: HEAT repeat domain-containing protein [Nitrospirota bacterium]
MNESLEKDVASAKDIVEGILKAKKLMRMYPANNPMHINASAGIFEKFNDFFNVHRDIAFKVTMNSLLYKDQQVYHKSDKDDNLAFFFFKDGIREISFMNGIDQQELEEFINILNIDFETDAPDDDIVTLLWDRDFKNLKYFVDQDFLGNWEVTSDSQSSDEKVLSAHKDALKKKPEKAVIQVELTESDFRYLADEMQKQNQPKLQKIIIILFESLYHTEETNYAREIIDIIIESIDYCIQESDFGKASYILNKLKSMAEDENRGIEGKRSLQTVYDKINSRHLIEKLSKPLDNPSDIDKEGFLAFAGHMDERSISSLIYLLGKLETIKGRYLVIDVLVQLGQQDINEVAKGLQDSSWHVVKNVAHVLGEIADPDSIALLVKTLSNSDHRVRKEVIIAIGNIRSSRTIRYLESTLTDNDKSVRLTAARTLGNTKTGDARKLLLSELSKKNFSEKDFSEKKEFYRIIAGWQEQDVKDFLIKTLNTKKFFKRAKNDENRACAAYALGLVKDIDAIKSLEIAGKSKNRVLRELSSAALKQLKG